MNRFHFHFLSGHPALDFINTVHWRGFGPLSDSLDRGMRKNERILSWPVLAHWSVDAGLLTYSEAARLRRVAGRQGAKAHAARRRAIEARLILAMVANDLVDGRLDATGIDEFNRLFAYVSARTSVLLHPSARAEWRFRRADRTIDYIWWRVVWDFGHLLTSDRANRIRRCDGKDCGWFFLDESRNGRRRWCSMATCGSRAKARTYYVKRATRTD